MSPHEPAAALLVGATGLVGGQCLDLLLARPEYERVIVLARRALERTHDKLEVHVVDFDDLASKSAAFAARDVYACLGTTIKVAGSQERFRRIDHDYTVEVARLARSGGARRLALVTSVGADATARTFYLRVKGETEADVAALGYETLAVLRPSFIIGERREQRTGEGFGLTASRAMSFLLVGGLAAYRPIAARRVAAAMIDALLAGAPGQLILEYRAIVERSAWAEPGAPTVSSR